MGGKGATVKAPEPSEEELQLRREQVALAQQQRGIIDEMMRQQNLLQPILMQNQGFQPTFSQVDPAAVERAGAIDARISELQGFMAPARVAQRQESRWVPVEGGTAFMNRDTGQYWVPSEMGGLPGPSSITQRSPLDPAWQQEIDRLNQERGTLADRLTGGRITGYELIPEVAQAQQRMRALQGQQDQITQMTQERTLKALRGELPIDPAIERYLSEGRGTLEDQLRSNLGTGYATSTPGIQALSEFDKRANEIRSAAQHDAIYNTSQLGMAGTDFSSRLNQMRFGNVVGLSGLQAGGAQLIGGVGQALNSPLAGFMADRNAQFQAAIQNAQSASRPSSLGSILGTIGGAIGTAIMPGVGTALGGMLGGLAGGGLGGGGGQSAFSLRPQVGGFNAGLY